MDDAKSEDQSNGSEIAIIGLSCRFPGANHLASFWQNLRDGVESISFLTDDELETSSIDPVSLNDPNYVKAASVIDNPDLFDAAFFGISPKEAEVMDPQHRLFLECSWEALEHAGYDAEAYKKLIGVFAGARTNTYLFNLYANRKQMGGLGSFEVGLGNDLAFLSTRISYKLNLRGPSYSVHTACSTALVAVHLACQSLLIDECQMAIAGGVAINVPHKTGYLYQHGGIVSPDGHCRTFDAGAQGTIFGSGIGVVVLKRLEDALADGDTVHAVIKGSAINNDGSPKASFTAPSVYGQTEVIAEALANSGVDASTIGYVETHGTATPLGDPIEIRALTKAFRHSTAAKNFCAIGSVKSNFGHLDAAAGVAGLIKTVLALKHRQLPPTLHYEKPNPQIDFDDSPFYVNTGLTEWVAKEYPRRAGISSFGVGGTNAHVVLEEAPPAEPTGESRGWQLLPLSAKTETALEAVTDNQAAHLRQHPEINLADVAYTLQVGRKAFNHRRVVVCRSPLEAADALESLDAQRVSTFQNETEERSVVYMFPGGGAQYVNMCRDLYGSERIFREEVDACARLLEARRGYDIRDYLFPDDARVEECAERLTDTSVALPALFVVEYALAKLWMSWGVRPQAMIGHSLGEYVAACLSGVFSLEDALSLVDMRGQLFNRLPDGAMLSVELGEQELSALLDGKLSLAAVNSPSLCVVSGPVAAIDDFAGLLAEKGIEHRRLHIAVAAHSQMVDAILKPFSLFVRQLKLHPPQIPFISDVTGTWITAEQATDAEYWTRHLRETVRFGAGVEELLKDAGAVFLEMGPGHTLSTLVKMQAGAAGAQNVITTVRHPQEPVSDDAVLAKALGRLWLLGVALDWKRYHAGERRRRLPLPTYPFERQRYWIEAVEQTSHAGHQLSAGKRRDLAEWFYVPSWKRTAPPKPFAADQLSERPKRWLIFEDEGGLGGEVVARLGREQADVIRVRVGETFGRDGENAYAINPRSAGDYETLLGELQSAGRVPDVIIHLWSLTRGADGREGRENFDRAQAIGFYSLLYLTQAHAKLNLSQRTHLSVVSNLMHEVESFDTTAPEKATLAAACKVIPQEFDHISCRCIDVALPPGTAQHGGLIDWLLTDSSEEVPDVVIAYRGQHRWVQHYEPLPLDAEDQSRRPLRENGVYMITGGLGGVGLLLAEYLVRTARAKLILTGRSSFPAREEWARWLETHEEADVVGRKIRKLQELEALGGEFLILSADVADEGQMRAVVDKAVERFAGINGVLHAAGVTSGASVFNPIRDISPEEAGLQFQPKGYGLYVLEKVLRGRDVDFCLLFSSNASVLGGLGFIAYSASNHFMDAFASNRSRTTDTVWISANWDPWPEETKHYTGYQTSMDQYTMTPDESVEAFRRVATLAPAGQVVVSTGDLQSRLNLWIRRDSMRPGRGAAAAAHPRPDVRSAYQAPRNEVEQTIADIWQELLGIEGVGIHDNFFDLGGHSLLATRLVSRMSDAFNADFQLGKFFELPTVVGLAQVVEETRRLQEEQGTAEILEMLAQLSDEEAGAELDKRTNVQ